jgi:hypothetical protein
MWLNPRAEFLAGIRRQSPVTDVISIHGYQSLIPSLHPEQTCRRPGRNLDTDNVIENLSGRRAQRFAYLQVDSSESWQGLSLAE